MTPRHGIDRALARVALGLIIVGCFLVLRPFLTAILWAAILAVTLYPLYARLLTHMSPVLASLIAVALIAAGAIGNILDRLRYEAGVVDFIDVGIGDWRFWTFNVADSAVSVGAVLLLISFWREERRAREEGTETAAG